MSSTIIVGMVALFITLVRSSNKQGIHVSTFLRNRLRRKQMLEQQARVVANNGNGNNASGSSSTATSAV